MLRPSVILTCLLALCYCMVVPQYTYAQRRIVARRGSSIQINNGFPAGGGQVVTGPTFVRSRGVSASASFGPFYAGVSAGVGRVHGLHTRSAAFFAPGFSHVHYRSARAFAFAPVATYSRSFAIPAPTYSVQPSASFSLSAGGGCGVASGGGGVTTYAPPATDVTTTSIPYRRTTTTTTVVEEGGQATTQTYSIR